METEKSPKYQHSHPATTGTDAVIITFQQTMLQMTTSFLQTQQQVMLAYLQSKSVLSPQYERLMTRPALQSAQNEPAPFNIKPRFENPVQAQPIESVAAVEHVPAPAPIASSQRSGPPSLPALGLPKTADELITSFIDLVSERTGYPAEMLDPALDLESDLGIDSIKRVEILSNFRRLLPEETQEKFEGDLEELGALRTLQEISDWIRKIPITVQSQND